MNQCRLSREELYNLVWCKPLSHLALEFDVSDVGLAKICARMAVPRPPRGYWARRRRSEVDKPALPQGKASTPQEVMLAQRLRTRLGSVTDRPPVILTSATLEAAHRLVKRTARGLGRARPDDRGLMRPRGRGLLALEVSREQEMRALLILDAVLNALEDRGHAVEASPDFKPKMVVEVGGESLCLSLKERLRRKDHRLTREEEEREARLGWRCAPRFDYELTGHLRFRIEELYGTGIRQTWSDGQVKPLEQKLGRVIVGIERAAEVQRERRLRSAAERERRHEEWRRQEEERHQREDEQRRTDELTKMASEWRAYREVVDFLKAVEQRVPPCARRPSLEHWLEWARTAADSMDSVSRLRGGLEE